MKIYLTSGSMDFMEALQQKYSADNMIVMHGAGNSILLHETLGPTRFNSPQIYEVIHSTGNLEDKGFFSFNYMPVTDEGQPIFEHQFKKEAHLIEKEPGFIALRLLKPTHLDTYIVLTEWENTRRFNTWKFSHSYRHILEDSDTGTRLANMPHMFSSAPYVATYKTKEDDDEEIPTTLD